MVVEGQIGHDVVAILGVPDALNYCENKKCLSIDGDQVQTEIYE